MKQMEPIASLSGNLAICPLEGHKTTLCCSGRDLMVCPEGFLFNREIKLYCIDKFSVLRL